ncbi:acyl-CoA dehydrogenase [Terriglobus albidus]|uniref:Acyl-CoA dehydrogenase n=1 Tax=Terriglobus albidus TaxID=1592106 RepID=A0A5B9EC94_9BACT|nr:acyl-CoA dehydrogenase family protein [Terriglobus albidus]QEE27927.1 acyl-CoA dehydrogenase [Terriglobus albidus]
MAHLFSLTAEQQEISNVAKKFAATEIAPHALEWDQARHLPLDVIRSTAPLGMGGIYVREDVGGSGLDRLDGVLIFEGLATGCPVISAYISVHNMVAWIIDTFGDESQRKAYLPRLCSMESTGAYALTEPSSGSDAGALAARAVRDGDTYVLNGVKQFISGAGVPGTIYIVMARTADTGSRGISAFLIEDGTPGLSFGAHEKKMGWHAQPTRQLILEDVRIPARNLIGQEGQGFKIAMAALDGGRLNIAACSLGGASTALEKTLHYVADRHAFGKRLADFQALQFRLADMATELEIARTFLWRAAASLSGRSRDATVLCAMAKRFVTDVGFHVANEALQLHGGYGYLLEYGIEKIVRDLRVHQILEGTNEIMRLIVSRSLLEDLK